MQLLKRALFPWPGYKAIVFVAMLFWIDAAFHIAPITESSKIQTGNFVISIVKDTTPKPTRATLRRDDVFVDRNGGTPLVLPGGSDRLKAFQGKRLTISWYNVPPHLFYRNSDTAVSIHDGDRILLQESEAYEHYYKVFHFALGVAVLFGSVLAALIFAGFRKSN